MKCLSCQWCSHSTHHLTMLFSTSPYSQESTGQGKDHTSFPRQVMKGSFSRDTKSPQVQVPFWHMGINAFPPEEITASEGASSSWARWRSIARGYRGHSQQGWLGSIWLQQHRAGSWNAWYSQDNSGAEMKVCKRSLHIQSHRYIDLLLLKPPLCSEHPFLLQAEAD